MGKKKWGCYRQKWPMRISCVDILYAKRWYRKQRHKRYRTIFFTRRSRWWFLAKREIQQSIHQKEKRWNVPLEHTRAAWDGKVSKNTSQKTWRRVSRRKTRAGYTMCCQKAFHHHRPLLPNCILCLQSCVFIAQ